MPLSALLKVLPVNLSPPSHLVPPVNSTHPVNLSPTVRNMVDMDMVDMDMADMVNISRSGQTAKKCHACEQQVNIV